MIDKEIYKKRIKILIGDRAIKTVADQAGCDPKTIRNAIEGKIPGVEILERLLAGEKTIGWLLGETIESSAPTVSTNYETRPAQESKDLFDRVMDEFYDMVKDWQAEENDRTIKTAIEFSQEFTLRFPEMRDWLKKRGRGGDMGRLHQKVSNTG